MKVLYINHSSGIQGACIALFNMINGVSKYGVEPVVVLPHDGPLANRFREIGVKVFFVKHYNAVYPRLKTASDYFLFPYRLIRTLIVNQLALRRFRKIVQEVLPDIIHSNSGVIRFGAIIADEQKIPHIWHVREFQSKDYFCPLGGRRRVKELFHQDHNHCIAITKAVADFFDLDLSKDYVIYDGVFSEDCKVPKVIEKKKYILFVGSLQKGKGIYDALYAFDSIASVIPKYELWLAGKDYIGIYQEINRCKNAAQIKYLGFRSDIYDLMANATALLVPSYFEGFGFISVEAMLNRTVVIGRDVAGTKEQFDNGLLYFGGEIGIRFTTTDELSQAIYNVCTRPSTDFQDMVENAYHMVMNCYTIEKNAQIILSVYEQLLQQ